MKKSLALLFACLLPQWLYAQAIDLAVPYRYDDTQRWVPVFESAERDAWQMPEKLMQALDIKPGQSIADLGAGSGYFTRRIANAVGKEGRVYAVDIELSMLTSLMQRADQEGLDHIIPIYAATHASRLPSNCCDLILLVNSYHMIPDRAAYLERLSKLLRPGGRIAIIGWKKNLTGPKYSPDTEFRLSAQNVKEEAEEGELELIATHDFLPFQHFQVFRAQP